MAGYVILRTDQGGGYVSRPGSPGSYTHRLELARIYKTRDAAHEDRCPGNEVVLPVDDILDKK